MKNIPGEVITVECNLVCIVFSLYSWVANGRPSASILIPPLKRFSTVLPPSCFYSTTHPPTYQILKNTPTPLLRLFHKSI